MASEREKERERETMEDNGGASKLGPSTWGWKSLLAGLQTDENRSLAKFSELEATKCYLLMLGGGFDLAWWTDCVTAPLLQVHIHRNLYFWVTC